MTSLVSDPILRIEAQVTLQLPMTALSKPSSDSRDLVLLLHGYQDSAEAFFRRVIPETALPFDVLAPNSPFPAPVRTDDGYREAYSWFFADRSKGQVLLHPEVGVSALTQLVERQGYRNHRKIIVGFSQGGYFAPFAARGLQNVVKIIGVGTGYRPADYEGLPVDDVDAVHGDRDEIVAYDHAVKGYEALRSHLKSGEFLTVSGLKHGIDDRAKKLILERVRSKFEK